MTMELMQKYKKEDGLIGIENIKRWPADSNAVKFLALTTSVAAVAALLKVSIFFQVLTFTDIRSTLS
jgi:hypothetical protein